MKHLHFPTAILTHQGGLVIAAAKNHAEIGTRLNPTYLTAAAALCTQVAGEVTGQKTAKGELGNLTTAQQQNLTTLHQCMTQAAKTAKLAFSGGQTVKLHQEFQIGAHDKNDLATFLSRCDTVLGSVQTAANLPTLKQKGWTDAETTAFQTARNAFGPAETYRVQQISGAKDTTTQKNADAAKLYEFILTIQNAADLEFPATDPANAPARAEFKLGIFPPDHHVPPAAPTPTPPATPAK